MQYFLVVLFMITLFLSGCSERSDEIRSEADVNISVGPSEVSLNFSDAYKTKGICKLYLSISAGMEDNMTQVMDINMSVQPVIINDLIPQTQYFGEIKCPPAYHVVETFRFITAQVPSSSKLSVQKVGNKAVTLSWENVTPAVSETIYVGTSKNFSKSDATKVLKNVKSPLTVEELNNGQTYYFRLAPVYNGPLESVLQSNVSGKPKLDGVALEREINSTSGQKLLTLKITKLMRSVTISWAKVQHATGYTLYLSTNSTIPMSDANTTQVNVSGGDTTSVTVDNLLFDTLYYTRMAAKDETSTSALSGIYHFTLGEMDNATVRSTKLNDTGVNATRCATTTEWVECKEPKDAKGNVVPYGQDGFYATNEKGGYSKELVEENGTVRDVNLGLRWYEHSTDRYTYYISSTDNPSPNSASLTENVSDTLCAIYSEANQTYCNSEAIVSEINKLTQLPCSTSWRLPTRHELRSLIYYTNSLPAIYPIKANDGDTLQSKLNSDNQLYTIGDTNYAYWTKEIALGNNTPGSNAYAWQVNLLTGEENIGIRSTKNRVMLVCPEP
jgi:hypothetical protein